MFHRAEPDKENDQRRASYAPPPATVRKRLFPTPITAKSNRAPRPSISSAASAYENSNDILRTPLPKIAPSAATLSVAASSKRRSSHAGPTTASLKGTPCFKRKYVETNPDVWMQRQVHDLTAWLNHELGDPSSSASYFPTQNFASSDVFIAQYAAMLRFYKGTQFKAEVLRFGNHIKNGKLSFSPAVSLVTEQPKFEQLVSLLTFSYNSTWLLLGLSLLLHTNFALQLDDVLRQAHDTPNKRVDLAVLQQKLVDYILRNHFTTENHVASKFTIASPRTAFTPSSTTDSIKQNGLVLYRTLLLIMLLDHAARDMDVVKNIPFPLFKQFSSVHKSREIVDRLSQICLQTPDSLARFLGDRGYRLEYDCPPWDRIGNFAVRDLGTDLRDGTRLCKLASMLTGDSRPLQQVKHSYGGRLSDAIRHKKYSFNIMIALETISKYAADRLRAKVQWKATTRQIIDGNIPETVALLWQIVELWIEIKLLDNSLLDECLNAAQNEFRARTADTNWCSSPDTFRELSPTIKSPSRLVIYQRPEKDCIRKLLQWCATVCGIHRIKVVDFTESFRDCAVLCILLDQLHPGLLDMKDIIRVRPAEIRDEQHSVKELEIVQNNIKLFEGACESLGALPCISISAMAALAPPFISRLKEESFGRLMILMTAYLFKRVELGRGAKERLEYVQQEAEKEVGYDFSRSPHECDNLSNPIEKKTWELPGSTYLGRLDTCNSFGANSEKACSPEGYEATPSVLVAEVDKPVCLSQRCRGSDSVTRPVTQSTPASPRDEILSISTPAVERKRKEDAAEVILSNYEAYKAHKNIVSKRDNAVLLQTLIRQFLAHQDYEELFHNQKELVRNLRSEFWNANMLAGSSKCSISNYDSCAISEAKKEASNGFGLCLNSLGDVKNVMLLLPDHLKTIDRYVQSMQEHEERTRNAPTQQALGIGVDFAPDNHPSSEKTHSTKKSELQVVNGIGSMVTAHFSVPDPSTPVAQSQTVSGYCSPSPGGERQVFRTPWTSIRPRRMASARRYDATPSDRYSWHTASPDIEKTKAEHHTVPHYPNTERSPSQDCADSSRSNSGEPSELSAEDGERRLQQFATEDILTQGQAEVNLYSQAMAAGGKALFSAALSTFGTLGRATHQYLRSRNEYMQEIATQSVHDAEAVLSKTSSPSHPYGTQGSPGSRTIGLSARSTGNTIPSNDSPGIIQSTADSGDEASPFLDGSLEDIHDSFETSYSPQACENVEQDLTSATGSEDSHDSDNAPEISQGTKTTGPSFPDYEANVTETPSLIAMDIDNEDALRFADIDVHDGQAAPQIISHKVLENSQLDEAEGNESDGPGTCPVLACESDAVIVNSEIHEGEGLELNHDSNVHHEAGTELVCELPDKLDANDGGEETGNIRRNSSGLDSCRNDDEEPQITGTALTLAENAYVILMQRLQSRHEDEEERRRGKELRSSELDKADALSMTRLKFETEKLVASLKTLEERYENVETPHSQSLEARRISAIVDEHDPAIPDTSFACDAEHQCDELAHVLRLMNEEDEVLRNDLNDIEYFLQKEHQESEVQLKSLMGTLLSSCCFLAERNFVHHMTERSDLRQKERMEREEEVHQLDQEFKKRMWALNLERSRIGEEERRLDSEIAALEVAYQQENNTVFELLEAEIDTRLLTIQNTEDKERIELLLRSESHEECSQRIIAVENLIKSYEQLKVQEHHQEDRMEEVQGHMSGESNLLEDAANNEERVEFYKDVHTEKSNTSTPTVSSGRYPVLAAASYATVKVRESLDEVGEENQSPSEFLHVSYRSSSSMQRQTRRPLSSPRVANSVLEPVNVHVDTSPSVKHIAENAIVSVNSESLSLQNRERENYFEQTTSNPRSPQERVRDSKLSSPATDANNLENLSVELSSFNITSSRKSVDDVLSNPGSASKLHALIRRISTATASPSRQVSNSIEHIASERHSIVCQNIIRTILVVLRHLHRTSTHIRLIDRGITIIRDFCEVQNRVADVITVEDCIDVIVTCAQFYRDREGILDAAVSVLYCVSQNVDGATLMKKNGNALKRLERINNLLNSAADQERKHRIRVQQARLIVSQVRLREKGVSRHLLLSEDLAAAQKESAPLELKIRRSHQLLRCLLSELKSKGVF